MVDHERSPAGHAEPCVEGVVGSGTSTRPPHTVLIALCGLSPAVITETVWALAHESPAILPDRVIVLTTRRN